MYEEKIKTLISKMTIKEKTGQLQQCGPSLVGAFEVSFEELLDMMFDGRISREEFDRLMSTAEQDYHEEDLKAGRIGSYNGIDHAATANRLQKIAVEETRLGIPLMFGYDVVHGFRTITPIPLAESCAWDEKLWEKTAKMAAREATAAGIHMTFAPMVDVAKDARWGRISEGAGEDTYLNERYGAAKVVGFQGKDLTKEDAMLACVKHFAAYGAVEAGRDYNRVDMSMQKLYEEYLSPYEACIKAGARAIMPAFNDINGVPCSVNAYLLTDVLRKDWGFTGVTVSDANAIAECVSHGIVPDRRSAAKEALGAGMNIDMTSNVYSENLAELIENSEVKENTLDQAVANVLRLKYELGLFEHPYRTNEKREERETLCKEYRGLAREAAAKSMVLLKNVGILPLKKGTKLGIVGELANAKGEMTGAWAIGANIEACISLVDACIIQNVSYTYGTGYKEKKVNKEEIKKIAAESDVLIAAIGEHKEESGEAASRADISLPEYQVTMLNCMFQTGKPVVAVLFNGRPLAIPDVAKRIPAILEAWHPGTEAGNALLDILFGAVNPSGKLTTTFPYTTGQCPMYYAHTNTGRPGGKSKFTSKYLDTPLEPVYPFGYGLSYTNYDYSNLRISKKRDSVRITVQVSNTGSMDGEEIVQCYMQDVSARRVRPVKKLIAFKKQEIKTGETVLVKFAVPFDKLGYYNDKMQYIAEPGEFKFYVGKNVADCLEISCICLD